MTLDQPSHWSLDEMRIFFEEQGYDVSHAYDLQFVGSDRYGRYRFNLDCSDAETGEHYKIHHTIEVAENGAIVIE